MAQCIPDFSRTMLVGALTITAFASFFVTFVSGSADERTYEIPLSCCGEIKVEFEKGCELHASVNEKAFAWFAAVVEDGTKPQCTSPCKHLEDGLMILDSCRNVNVSVVCTNNEWVTSDVTQLYIKKTCNVTGALSPDVFGLLVLLVVLCCTWQMIT